ncbi:hypothetical protein [Azospirillum argentinense]
MIGRGLWPSEPPPFPPLRRGPLPSPASQEREFNPLPCESGEG